METFHEGQVERANTLETQAAASYRGNVERLNGYRDPVAEARLRVTEQLWADQDGLGRCGRGSTPPPPAQRVASSAGDVPDRDENYRVPFLLTFDWTIRPWVVAMAFIAGTAVSVTVAFAI